MAGSKSPGDRGAGAGLSLVSKASASNENLADKGSKSIASRALALSTYFLSGALCINISQFLGTPLYLINQDWYNAWIAFTKQSFGLLTMTLTQTFSPTTVIVSGDASVRGEILRKADGTLFLDFPNRIVLIANHQIYTDWLYLWWTAYCSGMHGRLYIILKESLKRIPVIGWGMQLSQFIFLKRNWEKDKEHMAQALQKLNNSKDPMWLMLFPEGTNLAPGTRAKSAAWARKNGIKDLRHCLLPRSTGLRFCLQELKSSVGYVYDCTIAYHGVPRGEFAQDIYTLRAGYLEGRPPKSVSMYWRKFHIKDIPIHNQNAFDLWLIARWREKDLLMENYLIHGRFPADSGTTKAIDGKTKRGCGHLEVPIRSSHWYEFLQIFAPMGILAMVLYAFYGALPQRFLQSINGQALKTTADDMKKLKQTAPTSAIPGSLNLNSVFDNQKQVSAVENSSTAIANWVQSPEARRLLSRTDLVQSWLEDPQKLFVDTLAGNSKQQRSFIKSLRDEEDRRKRQNNPHQGTFWKDLNMVEASRNGSLVSSTLPTLKLDEKSITSRDLQLVRAKKFPPKTHKGTFWDDVSAEKESRNGSLITGSSVSSTNALRGPIPASGVNKTTRTADPKSQPKPAPHKLGAKTDPQSAASNRMPVLKPSIAKPVKVPNSNSPSSVVAVKQKAGPQTLAKRSMKTESPLKAGSTASKARSITTGKAGADLKSKSPLKPVSSTYTNVQANVK